MKRYYIQFLPHWVLTDLQPAFYDSESGTVLQQMSRLYPKIQELIKTYNDFVTDINNYIEEFEEGIIKDFNCFQDCVIKTMNDYIESIDIKIQLQNDTISNAIERQDLSIEEKFNNQDKAINNAVNYMKTNLYTSATSIINQAIENGELLVGTTYDDLTESLNIVVSREGD